MVRNATVRAAGLLPGQQIITGANWCVERMIATVISVSNAGAKSHVSSDFYDVVIILSRMGTPHMEKRVWFYRNAIEIP